MRPLGRLLEPDPGLWLGYIWILAAVIAGAYEFVQGLT